MEKILERANLLWAAAVTLLSAMFGQFWYLFMAFAIFNIVDYFTGWYRARITRTENSSKGFKGIVKKVGYWIIIGIAFFVAEAFSGIGTHIGINLGFTIFIGWFTLCAFIINEIRSILENLVEIGVEVPAWLSKGLEVANDKINDIAGKDDDDDDTD